MSHYPCVARCHHYFFNCVFPLCLGITFGVTRGQVAVLLVDEESFGSIAKSMFPITVAIGCIFCSSRAQRRGEEKG